MGIADHDVNQLSHPGLLTLHTLSATHPTEVFVAWLLSIPAKCEVYLPDGSVHSATKIQKLQIKLAISLSHSILTQGPPDLALTL